MDDKPFIEKLYWEDVRNQVFKVNKELAALIDNISPNKQYPLYKAYFPYGSDIVKDGYFYCPNNRGEQLTFTDSQIDKSITKDLSYNAFSNPLSILLTGAVEFFLEVSDIVIPIILALPGNILSSWLILSSNAETVFAHPVGKWAITSGARTSFSLPGINNKLKFKRINKYFGVKGESPKRIIDHHNLFKQMYMSRNFESNWRSEVLYFSKSWIELFKPEKNLEHIKDINILKLKYFLTNNSWQNSEFLRNSKYWDVQMADIKTSDRINSSKICDDTIKHIMSIAMGAAIGFKPYNDNTLGPYLELQNAFVDIYGLDKYTPVILGPAKINPYENILEEKNFIYYSLMSPTLLDFYRLSCVKESLMSFLYDIKFNLTKYKNALAKPPFCIDSSAQSRILDKVSFDFFHNAANEQDLIDRGIQHVSTIPQDDPEFTKVFNKTTSAFSGKRNFLEACIRISY